jgi:thiol-disulfide isomerase/thioredoxin
MSRMLFAVALAAAVAGAEPTLKVGDPAPPLTIAKWVKGNEVKAFEKGKPYVVEFWATWCGPCVQSMPHLTELQETYKDKITFLGVTSEDANNTLDRVEAMVGKKGPLMGYTVAWDEGRTTFDAWMTAAEQRGIPCAFVVDGTGKIAYIGHPITLDLVLSRLVAGKWDPVDGPKELEAAFQRAGEALQMDRDLALKAIEAFEKDYPELAWTEAVASQTTSSLPAAKLRLLLLAGRNEEATALGRKLVERGIKFQRPDIVNEAAWLVVDPQMKIENRDLAFALEAANKAVELSGGDDGGILDTLARVYYWKGDLAKAIEIQEKAIAKASPEMLGDLTGTLEDYKQALKERNP